VHSASPFWPGSFGPWQQMVAAGYFMAANPAYSFFFLLTAVHGIHFSAACGCGPGRPDGDASRRRTRPIRLSVELCTVYWHYLLVVWVVLFAVLLHAHD